MQHSKILLTGSHGFIGGHYYHHLQQKNEHVIPYDKKLRGEDLADKNTTQLLPDVDTVVHLAATNGTALFYEQPTDVLINNTIPTINLVERYRNTNTKFVFASTCEIFNGAIDAGYTMCQLMSKYQLCLTTLQIQDGVIAFRKLSVKT